MTTRADVIAEARSWLGTPFAHQGRLRGVGVDCAGIVIGVAHALGISDFDHSGYGREPHGAMLTRLLNEHLIAIPVTEPAAVLEIAFAREPQHLAILTDVDTIVHAYQRIGACREHSFGAHWRRRVRGIYRFPGVT
jgi:NlpC/P60 family putative phage cell wall peptidase